MLTIMTPMELDKIFNDFNDDADRGDQFGWKVAMTNDGQVAIIGAPKDDALARNAGAAYVFYNSGANDWVQIAKVIGPSGSVGRNDEFGEYVAVTGDVSDFSFAVGTEQTNEVFVYDGRSVDVVTGNFVGALSADTILTANGDPLGSISVSRREIAGIVVDETLVAGSARNNDHGTASGAAYVFTAPGGDWGVSAAPTRLVSTTPATNEFFGSAVRISADGNTIAVGAEGASEVHIFERGLNDNDKFDEETDDHKAVITSEESGGFGSRVDISGDGGVLVASNMWTTWIARPDSIQGWIDDTLTASEHELNPFFADPNTNATDARFGFGININDAGDTIIVGTGSNPEKTAFSYSTSSSTNLIQGFGQQARYASQKTTDGNLSAVATNGTQVLIGNTFDDAEGETFSAENVGAVHVFSLAPTPVVPGTTVTPRSGLVTTETGGTDVFTIVLDTQPADDVTINLSSSDPTEGTVSPPSITFTSGNWDLPRTITVTGEDDGDSDGDIAYSIITAAASSSDPDYGGLDPDDVFITNLDDEVPLSVVVETIDPDFMNAGDTIDVTVTGSGFNASATLSFANGSGPAPSVSVIAVSPKSLTATVSIGTNGPKGERLWDVVVTNPDSSSDSLVDAFRVCMGVTCAPQAAAAVGGNAQQPQEEAVKPVDDVLSRESFDTSGALSMVNVRDTKRVDIATQSLAARDTVFRSFRETVRDTLRSRNVRGRDKLTSQTSWQESLAPDMPWHRVELFNNFR